MHYAPTNGDANAPKVVLVDCGVKHNIIRCLIKRGVEVIRVPWDYNFNEWSSTACFWPTAPAIPTPA